MPWMMFGGIFIKISDTPKIFRWLFDISFMKHAMEGIVHCVYGLNRPKLYCTKVCHGTCYIFSDHQVLLLLIIFIKFFRSTVITLCHQKY